MDTLAYTIDDNLYINLTNRCSNACKFCVRNGQTTYEGYPLWLSREHSVPEIIQAMGDIASYREIVFCGFGEPTYRVDAIREIAAYCHSKGKKTRLNTNGHGNLINGRNIAPELADIDLVNVSLNEVTAEAYDAVCRPIFAEAYAGLRTFARSCKEAGISVVYSVVDIIGEQKVEIAKQMAKEAGIPLRVRPYIAHES